MTTREGGDVEAAARGAHGEPGTVTNAADHAPAAEAAPGAPAIQLRTEVPGPRSRALGEERRRWVSRGVSEARHGVFFERGEGAQLVDVDGNVFLDMGGGIGCMNAGHSAPLVLERAREQMERLQHACF